MHPKQVRDRAGAKLDGEGVGWLGTAGPASDHMGGSPHIFLGSRVHHGYSEHCSILVTVVTVTVTVSNFSTLCIPCTLTCE